MEFCLELEQHLPLLWVMGKLSDGQKTREILVKATLKVISSETANNAATGAAMIPLLALGLPGGALTAIMVAVFQFHDMEPGPLVFYSPELIWVVFAAMFYANVSILFIGLIETKLFLQLLRIPFHFLAPMILMLASIGAYIGRGLVLDVMVMFLAGMIGFHAEVGLFHSRDRVGHHSWKNWRTKFRARHANGAL